MNMIRHDRIGTDAPLVGAGPCLPQMLVRFRSRQVVCGITDAHGHKEDSRPIMDHDGRRMRKLLSCRQCTHSFRSILISGGRQSFAAALSTRISFSGAKGFAPSKAHPIVVFPTTSTSAPDIAPPTSPALPFPACIGESVSTSGTSSRKRPAA